MFLGTMSSTRRKFLLILVSLMSFLFIYTFGLKTKVYAAQRGTFSGPYTTVQGTSVLTGTVPAGSYMVYKMSSAISNINVDINMNGSYDYPSDMYQVRFGDYSNGSVVWYPVIGTLGGSFENERQFYIGGSFNVFELSNMNNAQIAIPTITGISTLGLISTSGLSEGWYAGAAPAPVTAPTPTSVSKHTGVSENLTGGTLSLSAPSVSTSFPAFTLDGSTATLDATLSNWSIIDATGTGDGWNVQLQASQLTEATPTNGFANGTSALSLPQGSLSLVGVRRVTASTGSKPVSTTYGPSIFDSNTPIDVVAPIKLLQASLGYGLGTYTVQEPSNGLTLTLDPSTTKVDSINYPNEPTPYQTTLTYNVVTGP